MRLAQCWHFERHFVQCEFFAQLVVWTNIKSCLLSSQESAFTDFFEISEIPASEFCYNNFPISNGRNCTAIQSLYYCVFNNSKTEAENYLYGYFETSKQLMMATEERGIDGNGGSSGQQVAMSAFFVLVAVILVN
jgi:hypothetical protein